VSKKRKTTAKTSTRKKVTAAVREDPVQVTENKVKHPGRAVQPRPRFHCNKDVNDDNNADNHNNNNKDCADSGALEELARDILGISC
jgi:hypothetical protein